MRGIEVRTTCRLVSTRGWTIIMTLFWAAIPFVSGALGIALSWAVLEFVAKPIRAFFDLRKEASRVIAKYDQEHRFNLFAADAKAEYTNIGAELVAFARSETAASRLIWLRYDPRLAGDAMLVIASKWGDALSGWAVERAMEDVRQALRLPG